MNPTPTQVHHIKDYCKSLIASAMLVAGRGQVPTPELIERHRQAYTAFTDRHGFDLSTWEAVGRFIVWIGTEVQAIIGEERR